MARIAIDMDGVLANYLKKQLVYYTEVSGHQLSLDELRGKKLRKTVEMDISKKITEYMHDIMFFEDLEIMENSQYVLRQLSSKHEIFIASAAMEFPNSFNAKYKWLKKNFSFIPDSNIVFCGNKSIICADYLIDDHAHNLESFPGTGLLFSAPHNFYEKDFIRVDNWSEVLDYFKNSFLKSN